MLTRREYLTKVLVAYCVNRSRVQQALWDLFRLNLRQSCTCYMDGGASAFREWLDERVDGDDFVKARAYEYRPYTKRQLHEALLKITRDRKDGMALIPTKDGILCVPYGTPEEKQETLAQLLAQQDEAMRDGWTMLGEPWGVRNRASKSPPVEGATLRARLLDALGGLPSDQVDRIVEFAGNVVADGVLDKEP